MKGRLFGVTLFLMLLGALVFAQTPCKTNQDCKKLSTVIKLDQNVCVGQEHLYDGQADPLIPVRPYLWNELVGKTYTGYIQTGYEFTYKCKNGYCVKDEVNYDPYILRCNYGCLVTPTKKNGTEHSNLCVCKSGQIGEAFCDPSKGRDVYYTYLDWTCEKETRIVGYCPVGSKCSIDSSGKNWTCKPLKATEMSQANNGSVQYSLLFPGRLENGTVMVAAYQNGKKIGEKPISNLSAMEYINKYGALHASQATYFAQATGLTTTIASIQNKTITPGYASITIAYASYTPRTINTYTYKPSRSTTRTNTYKPSYYSNYYTRTYTPKASYTPYASTHKTTRAYTPNYYSNHYTNRTYAYTPRASSTRTYSYKPANTHTKTTSYAYTPKANYTSRTYTRNTYTPTTNYTKYAHTPKTYAYTPKTSNTRTYSYKPRTTRTITHEPTTTSTTYSRYYKRTFT